MKTVLEVIVQLLSSMYESHKNHEPDGGSTFLTGDHLVTVMATQITRTAGLARLTLENHQGTSLGISTTSSGL